MAYSRRYNTQQRYAATPDHRLASRGFTKLRAIEELTERRTKAGLSPSRSPNTDIDCLSPKDSDIPAQAQWRAFMASDFAKTLYIHRGAIVEYANAKLRRRDCIASKFAVSPRRVALGCGSRWHTTCVSCAA